jgi:hypothetical protein
MGPSLTTLRYIGSGLILAGYFVLLYMDVYWGVMIRLLANLFSLPWALKHKFWDIIVILGFFIAMESHKLYTLHINRS